MAKREKPLENKVFFNRETDLGFLDLFRLFNTFGICYTNVGMYIIKVSYDFFLIVTYLIIQCQ